MGLYRSRLVVFDRHGLTDRYHFREFIKYFMYGLVANRTLVNSSDIYQKVRKRAPWLKGRLDLHWNAVSNVEQLDHANRTYLRSVSEKHIKLICAASYRELKNAHGLIEALAKINDEGLFEFTLNWYGNIDNPPSLYYEKLDQLVEIHGLSDCVRLNSFSSNIYSEIVKSDFVVLPSYFEGCPNFLIEGMFYGKPVLASNTSSNPEIVSDKGGFLFNPYDVDSIVHALQKAYYSSIEDRKLMGEANRLQAETMFSIDRNLKKLYQVINMQLY
jgi:glycosyltransferase involved in cell wall biosynthesis